MTLESGITFLLAVSILALMSGYTYTRNQMGKEVKTKWIGRKFVATVVASVVTLLHILGVNIETQAVALVDTICLLFVGFQGYLDVKKAKNEELADAGRGALDIPIEGIDIPVFLKK